MRCSLLPCSVTIKSPYVADVQLADGSIALAHAPGMELGGLCVAGARVLLSRNAAGGTTKTAFAIQLVAAEAGCWVGAHPSLGNKLVAAALRRGLLASALGAHASARAEATHGRMRVDFELAHASGGRTLVEVKNVVCSDYPLGSRAKRPKGYDLVYSPHADGPAYKRAAVFPVGKLGQKLEDGTKCVSTRAIKHVSELAALAAESEGATKARALPRAVLHLLRAEVLERAAPSVLTCAHAGGCGVCGQPRRLPQRLRAPQLLPRAGCGCAARCCRRRGLPRLQGALGGQPGALRRHGAHGRVMRAYVASQ